MSKRAKAINLPIKFVQPLDESTPVAEQISSSLRMAILNMSLTPGQIISEAEIGNLFGVSRTPVRESFSLLREQGLIVTYPSRGNYVTKLSIAQIKSAQFVRKSLEVAIVEQLCEVGLTFDAISDLEDNLESQQKLLLSGQRAEFFKLDEQFHLALTNAANNQHIWDVIVREKVFVDRLRVLSLNKPAHMETLLEEHRDIFKAICLRDKTLAADYIRKHLHCILDTLSNLVEEHSEYFDHDE